MTEKQDPPKITERRIIAFAIVWDVVFAALYPLMNVKYDPSGGLNLAFAALTYRGVMYLHGLLVAYVATLALVIVELFSINGHTLQGRERTLVRYSALFAIVIGGIGGIINFGYIAASGLGVVNESATWVQIIAFFAMDEIAIALIYFLSKAPRNAGVGYRQAGLAFYLLLAGVISGFIAAVIGHLGGFVIQYGNSFPIIGNYALWLGLDVPTLAANLVGSHSHEMVVALLAIIVALVAGYFGYSKLSKGSRTLAQIGLLVSIIGVLMMTTIYVASSLYSYSVPSVFNTDNGGIALDDIFTGIVGAGAVILAIALLGPWYMKAYGNNPSRVAVITFWVLTIITVLIFGYFIELNTNNLFGGSGSVPGAPLALNDQAYTRFHQDFAFFVLPMLSTAILAMEFYLKSAKPKMTLALAAIIGSWVAFIGGTGLIFVNPTGVNVFRVVEYIGAGLIAVSALGIALYLFGVLKDETAGTTAVPKPIHS